MNPDASGHFGPYGGRFVPEALVAALDEPGEWRDRWQQLTDPATAKGVEDRAFWRYVPLASLAEVA